MYCLPEHRALSIYPEERGSISPNSVLSVTTHNTTIAFVVVFLSISLVPPSSPVFYTSLSSTPVRKVLAYCYSN